MNNEQLPFLPEERLMEIKIKLSAIWRNFQLADNSWLVDFFGDKPFKLAKIQYEPFNLSIAATRPFETEGENVRRVYSQLIHLTDSQASDERLWAALCLGPFYTYAQYRWGVDTEQKIRDHFFFNFGPRRSIMRNSMSRLWWIGRFTYDETLADPFQYSDYLTQHPDFVFHVLELNLSNNKQLVKVLFKVLLDFDENEVAVNTNHLGELMKYYNVLGGVHLLDMVPSDLLYQKLTTRLKRIIEMG